MEKTAFKGTPVHTCGKLPQVGSIAPRFTLTRGDLTELRSEELKGRRIVLNIFPSLDTAVCATSVRKFNQLAASLDNTTVVAVSKDLPFAQSRFCTTEGIENLIAASAFRSPEFGKEYGVEMTGGYRRNRPGNLRRARARNYPRTQLRGSHQRPETRVVTPMLITLRKTKNRLSAPVWRGDSLFNKFMWYYANRLMIEAISCTSSSVR